MSQTKPNVKKLTTEALQEINCSQQLLITEQTNKITKLNAEIINLKRRLDLVMYASKKSG